jgi:hypothetical protein
VCYRDRHRIRSAADTEYRCRQAQTLPAYTCRRKSHSLTHSLTLFPPPSYTHTHTHTHTARGTFPTVAHGNALKGDLSIYLPIYVSYVYIHLILCVIYQSIYLCILCVIYQFISLCILCIHTSNLMYTYV